MTSTEYPAALPHGYLKEIFPDVFFVKGTTKMPGPFAFSRNMTVIREGAELALINTIRLGEAGLASLEKLGRVRHVIRLAGFHGVDDPFYKDRYSAKVWTVKGQPYLKGFKRQGEPYFNADIEMDETTPLPFKGMSLYQFKSAQPGEALLLLERDGGIIVSGDCLQNWATSDEFFTLGGKLLMRMMGFIRAHNVGPGWLKQAKPSPKELEGILGLRFEHVLPAHGEPVIGGALNAFRPGIMKASRSAR